MKRKGKDNRAKIWFGGSEGISRELALLHVLPPVKEAFPKKEHRSMKEKGKQKRRRNQEASEIQCTLNIFIF